MEKNIIKHVGIKPNIKKIIDKKQAALFFGVL